MKDEVVWRRRNHSLFKDFHSAFAVIQKLYLTVRGKSSLDIHTLYNIHHFQKGEESQENKEFKMIPTISKLGGNMIVCSRLYPAD